MTTANPNVDDQEIAKFEQLASRWWDPDSEFKSLHDMNPLRLNYIEERAGGLAGKQVLDVGCGGGILAESMALRGAQVLGIDMGEVQLAVARLHQLESGAVLDYQRVAAEELVENESARFDVVACMEILEHVPDPASTIQACARLIKPGGHVFFSTINRNLKSYLFAIIGAEYILQMLPQGTHDFRKFIRPSELDRWTRTAGLDIQHLAGLHFNPFTRRYWLGSGVMVNYMVHCQMDSFA